MSSRAGRCKSVRKRAGLTLVEVLIALTILGIGITYLVATASKCLSVARKARYYENARRLIGQVELEEPLFLKEEITPGVEEGSFDHPFSQYKWKRTIEQVGEEEDGFFLVRISVIWSERGRQNKEEVETYLYLPEAVEGGSFEH